MNAIDVEASPNCICANLRKASRAVSQAYDEALRPTGLKATQYTLLATLAGSGELALTRLAHLLVLDRTTLTRNLQPLIRRGLVQDAAGEDQRVRRISLTPQGERVYRQALVHWSGVQRRVAAGLGEDSWPGFLDGLRSAVKLVQGP